MVRDIEPEWDYLYPIGCEPACWFFSVYERVASLRLWVEKWVLTVWAYAGNNSLEYPTVWWEW